MPLIPHRGQIGDGVVEDLYESTYTSQGLSEACKFVYNDAKYVNERARNDIVLLSRYFYLRIILLKDILIEHVLNCLIVYSIMPSYNMDYLLAV